MAVITGPGTDQVSSPILDQAYDEQDKAIGALFRSIIAELDRFTRMNKSVQVLGFDAQRYIPLERDARQAVSDLTRSLARWEA